MSKTDVTSIPATAGPITRRTFMGGCIASWSVVAGLEAGMTADRRKLVLVAGPDSHSFGEHEHAAGCRLLARHLRQATDQLEVVVHTGGWPADERALRFADAVVIYADGGGDHPMSGHQETLEALAERGVGLGFLHYALIPPDKTSYAQMLAWIGGYYEPSWSVNPLWSADFAKMPVHPITRGVEPFNLHDEWYYHMRFRERMSGVTPLLSALPPADTLKRPDGPHSNNPHVRAAVIERRERQHLAWACHRSGDGRGFGFTGGHFHWNWAHDEYRTFLLNAAAWLAGVNVPKAGLRSAAPDMDELLRGLPKPPDNWNRAGVEAMLRAWRQGE